MEAHVTMYFLVHNYIMYVHLSWMLCRSPSIYTLHTTIWSHYLICLCTTSNLFFGNFVLIFIVMYVMMPENLCVKQVKQVFNGTYILVVIVPNYNNGRIAWFVSLKYQSFNMLWQSCTCILVTCLLGCGHLRIAALPSQMHNKVLENWTSYIFYVSHSS